ncbi:MAG: argininosuccinate lyase, partial [Methanoregulaceae archaeon]|nr:argininosuccinate lyase [Methanoregulaceae archaeon]
MREDVIRRGRFRGSRDAGTAEFLSSMEADRFIADADLMVDIAHLLMLERQGLVDRPGAGKLIAVLLDLVDEGIPESVFEHRFEDIHAGIEAFLVEKTGEDVGGRLHMGRSRNDEVATCIRLRLREALICMMDGLLDVREVLAGIAKDHTATIMPGFTHMQHAQPTTLAHHLLGYEQALSRDSWRLSDAYNRVNLCPLGAAAFAGTGYRIDREWTAKMLGFDGMLENTMDAVASRDFALEVLADCAVLMTTVSRLCEELVLWSSRFVRFAELDDAHASTSSI